MNFSGKDRNLGNPVPDTGSTELDSGSALRDGFSPIPLSNLPAEIPGRSFSENLYGAPTEPSYETRNRTFSVNSNPLCALEEKGEPDRSPATQEALK